MSLESRIVQLETARKPSDDLQTRLNALARWCSRMSQAAVRDMHQKFLYSCTDTELLEIAGLTPDATNEEVLAVALSGSKREH